MAKNNLKMFDQAICLQTSQNVFARLLGQARACMLVQILLASAFAVGANGQTPQTAPVPTTTLSAVAVSQPSIATSQPVSTTKEAKQEPRTSPGTTAAPASKDSNGAVPDYKTSLKELSKYYERESERIADENGKLKGLYSDGLIARVELEASDKSLAQAQAKLEEMRKQITGAESPLQLALATDTVQRSELAWTTGDEKI